jgi:hypothetical protein
MAQVADLPVVCNLTPVRVLFALVLFASPLACQARWVVLLDSTTSRGRLELDTSSVQLTSGAIAGWFRMTGEFSPDSIRGVRKVSYTLARVVAKCETSEVAWAAQLEYAEDRTVLSSFNDPSENWRFTSAPPDSRAEAMVRFMCVFAKRKGLVR